MIEMLHEYILIIISKIENEEKIEILNKYKGNL